MNDQPSGSRVAWTALAASVLLAGVGAVAAPDDQDPPAAFRTSTDVVSVGVNVVQRGRPVTDLVASDFQLLDNGVRQTVTNFSYERLPIDVTVALDISDSVSGRLLDELRRGVGELRAGLRDGDRLKLMTFNQRIRRLVDFADRPVNVNEVFGRLEGIGGTSFVDALTVALASASVPDRRHLIIGFSDGADTTSLNGASQLLDVVRRTTATLTLVRPMTMVMSTVVTSSRPSSAGLPSAQDSGMATGSSTPSPPPMPTIQTSARSVGDDTLWRDYRSIAIESGGEVVVSPNMSTLRDTFRSIVDRFRSSYMLHYTPTPLTSGTHTIDVRVSRQGAFEIRSRKSYVIK
jgi:VWFA-related protein